MMSGIDFHEVISRNCSPKKFWEELIGHVRTMLCKYGRSWVYFSW